MTSGVPKGSTNTAVLKFDNYIKGPKIENSMVVKLAQEAMKSAKWDLSTMLDHAKSVSANHGVIAVGAIWAAAAKSLREKIETASKFAVMSPTGLKKELKEIEKQIKELSGIEEKLTDTTKSSTTSTEVAQDVIFGKGKTLSSKNLKKMYEDLSTIAKANLPDIKMATNLYMNLSPLAKIELLLICSKIPKLDKKAIDAIVNKRLPAEGLGKLCLGRDTDAELINELRPFLEKILNATATVSAKKLDQDAMRDFEIAT